MQPTRCHGEGCGQSEFGINAINAGSMTAAAGDDTPVLILDHVSLGTQRTYSARVLVYDNAYAGTWSAVDHGGLVMGAITHGKN